MQIYKQIMENKVSSKKMLGVLLDPDKNIDIKSTIKYILQSNVDIILVGGSGYLKTIDNYIDTIHFYFDENKKSCPILLFPGDICQFSYKADALLFLSLISSRNAELLIGRHIKAAKAVYESGIETIPMGYILIDGGKETTVQRVTQTTPLKDHTEIVNTALAGFLSGKKLIYLEAGSGAKIPVSSEIIKSVSTCIDIPLIVGGGICTTEQLISAYSAGADIVIIGNHFEQYPEQIPMFTNALKQYNEKQI